MQHFLHTYQRLQNDWGFADNTEDSIEAHMSVTHLRGVTAYVKTGFKARNIEYLR